MLVNLKNGAVVFRFIIACAMGFAPLISFANESLRITGMGGAFAGLSCAEGAIFGNPAGLVSIQDNNISIALSAQNLNFQSLPSDDTNQMDIRLSFRLSPSIYYSRVAKGIGIGLGYVDDLDNRSNTLRVENTEAEYIVDERKFVSDTDTVFEYDLFRDSSYILALGYTIDPDLTLGIRMEYRRQIAKKGTITRPLRLTAVHGEEVNRNDATKLIPAIIDNLNIEDSIERFKQGKDSHEEVIADLSRNGLDIDLGIQKKLTRNLSIGFMLDHLFQQKIIEPHSSKIRLGIGFIPANWLTMAFDLQKALNDRGLDINTGWEIDRRWKRWFSGGIIVRNGFIHDPEGDIVSLGLGLALGGSHWDYTLAKPFGSPIRSATHMFSSTTRF